MHDIQYYGSEWRKSSVPWILIGGFQANPFPSEMNTVKENGNNNTADKQSFYDKKNLINRKSKMC